MLQRPVVAILSMLAAELTIAPLSSCDEDGGSFIEGSLGDFYDLTCIDVRARLYSSELAIEYVNITQEVPVRVTVDRKISGLNGPATVDLIDFGEDRNCGC